MAKGKLSLLIAVLSISSALNSAHASEELIEYYDVEPIITEEYLLKPILEEDQVDVSNEEESTVSFDLAEIYIQEDYLDTNIDREIVYYDARDLDRVFDSNYDPKNDEPIYNPSKKTPSNEKSLSSLKDGILYETVNGKAQKAANKWITIGDDKFYADENGKAVSGKRNISGKDYYFGKDYKLAISTPVILDGGKYEANETGSLSLIEKPKSTWASVGDKSYYYGWDGNLLRGLADLGDARYYFDKTDGLMLRNQIINDGIDKIHTADNGVAHYLGWDYYNGKLGYFNEDGTYSKGLKTINGMTYGFDDEGKIYNRQNKIINGQWYYFNKYGEASKSDGKFYTGWVGDRYYFADGKPAEGIQTIDGKTYIFHELTLNKQRNVTKVFNHKKYKTDNNGVATYIGDVAKVPARAGTAGQFKPGFSQYLNRKTPYFTQNDPRWKNKAYSAGTYGAYGCGPTVMAMVLNRKLNRNDIYPTTTAVDARPYTAYNGTDWQYLIEGPEIYGLKTYEVPVNEKAFIQALKKNPIIVRVGNGYFINTGHYMVIDSYKDGKFIINDPFYSQKNTLESHDFWRLKQEVSVAWEVK